MAVFLTDEWFSEVERLGEEAGDLNLPPALANMSMNLKVTDAEGGDVQAYLSEGKLKKGETNAPTTLSLNKEALKDLVFDFDMNKAMQAFMSGNIRVEGDMSQLMTLQSARPSDEQKQLFENIMSITEQA
ncbi:SCP2 sterol-binding domain-containing protein [Psychrobacter sp. I-STPA10]|uniref:SCP2 sterol-binding domain-containing protein n=1 Tax=Psychrobacter sp. I-STPA10 TaxID=2585769 RepID=UPI001E439A6F|nr:SCP2 sterol-binding domain-containing protein [Psychrobacter sp. I-STPA10]